MSEVIKENKVSCDTCIGACCLKGTKLPLTKIERAFMENGGTQFCEISPPPEDPVADLLQRNMGKIVVANVPIEPRGVYEIISEKCGYCDDNGRCLVHEDPNRPLICESFTAGDPACLQRRILEGVNPKE